MGLGKISTKMCAQLHVFSLWRLTWVFDGTWKNFHKKVCPVTRFFAVETILSFWWDLESVDKKLWPVAPFWQYRLSQVFGGLGKIFTKKLCPVTRFVRCGDHLKFWIGLRKVSTERCDQLHLFGSADALKFLTQKNSNKNMCSVTRFFAVETISKFWWDLGKFRQKGVTSYTVLTPWRLT